MAGDDDLVHRLRNPDKLDGLYSLCRKAAAEIETLRRRLDNFDDWVKVGYEHDWITHYCGTHGNYPHATYEERDEIDRQFESGDDPCLPGVVLSEIKPQVAP